MTKFSELNETEKRAEASVTVQRMTALINAMVPAEEGWRLMLSGALVSMLPVLGDQGAADTLRELADDIEGSTERAN